ncbi:hypothetical protein [Actinoplanes sp. NBRC 103695]|uniref:hypothetical protein n=1 Tax=Actinoplanes sp. NBRC 103695 TaxID=3032202 RepID=UPI002554621C|nr:hypothetical protein [Actinoplanes sp. NBRC 103695]
MFRTGLVVAVLLGVIDLANPFTTDGEHPPMVIALITAALGVVTIVGAVPAWRSRSRGGVVAIVVSRLLSAVSALPALVVSDVPGWIRVLSVVFALITLASVAMIAPALRRRATAAA